MARTFVLDAIPDRDGKVVANVIAFPTTNPDWEANAAIISAAPDLLAAVEAVAADYGITLQPVPCEVAGSDLHSTAIRLLRAAYAKAKGGAA